jgi:hypothetical protein
MQGRPDEALACYLEASRLAPGNAAAYYNAAQIHTQRFQYREATEAITRASGLNFDLVKSFQSQATEDGMLPLIDQWLAPSTFWRAVAATPMARPAAIPPAWRGHIETRGWDFSVVVLVLAIGALAFGLWQHRALPLRSCTNCGAAVCRRCAERRRELALCPTCASVESRAESPEFARVLLLQYRRGHGGRQRMLRTALATLIPGFGLLACGRVGRPALLLVAVALLSGSWLGLDAPFTYEPRLAVTEAEAPLLVTLGLWAAVYLISLLAYLTRVSHLKAQETTIAAPVRSRSVQSTRRISAEAA